MMMAYGLFVFGLDTAAYEDLQHQLSWRHESTGRVGRRPARQYLGPDDDTVSLSGKLLPPFTGGQQSLDDLREMADAGDAWPLIEGTGANYGLYVIQSLRQRKSHFFRDGAPARVEFELQLARVDDDDTDRLAAPDPEALEPLLLGLNIVPPPLA